MRDEKTAAIIRDKAAEIMERIQHGRLYGEPIDLFNPEEIIYAAYLVGSQDEAKDQAQVGDGLRSMLTAKPL